MEIGYTRCIDCEDAYPANELTGGMCADCYADFSGMDLEDQLEELLA